jgi:hypothetical protein
VSDDDPDPSPKIEVVTHGFKESMAEVATQEEGATQGGDEDAMDTDEM